MSCRLQSALTNSCISTFLFGHSLQYVPRLNSAGRFSKSLTWLGSVRAHTCSIHCSALSILFSCQSTSLCSFDSILQWILGILHRIQICFDLLHLVSFFPVFQLADDPEDAYNELQFQLLWELLAQNGVSLTLTRWLVAALQERKVVIRLGNLISTTQKFTMGLPQATPTPPPPSTLTSPQYKFTQRDWRI